MIAKLACGNVRRSYKDFAIFFFTLVMGVAVYYAFNSITAQQTVLDLSTSQSQMIESLGMLIDGVSVFIAVILAFLVVYANRFLIRRRNREFATYLLLGMPKASLLRMSLVESILVGVISVLAGLALGLVFSQILLWFTSLLFVANVPGFAFVVAFDQLLETVVVFAVVFALALLVNAGYVMKAKLIDLMLDGRKNDDIKLRSIPLSFILFVVACGLIAAAYYLLLENGIMPSPQFALSTLLVCVGSLLFFYSLAGFLLRVFQLIKPLYYRGLNMFVLRQVASRINSSFASMTVICMTLFLAITSVCGGIGICNALQSSLESSAHYSATITSYTSYNRTSAADEVPAADNTATDSVDSAAAVSSEDSAARDGASSSGVTTAEGQDDQQHFTYAAHRDSMAADLSSAAQRAGATTWDSMVAESVQIDYVATDITFGQLDGLAGKPLSEYASGMVTAGYETTLLQAVPLSQFNRALEMAGETPVSLADNEVMLNGDFDITRAYLEDICRSGTTLDVFGHTMHLAPEFNTSTVHTTNFPMQVGCLIVPDAIIPDSAPVVMSNLNVMYRSEGAEESFLAMLDTVDWDTSDELNTEYEGFDWSISIVQTRQSVFDQSVNLTMLVSYLAVYIGFVLVVACAAILAIQQLTAVSDSRSRYQLLSKLGVSSGMLNGALFKQIAIAFLFPLVLAAAHSVCAMTVVVDLVSIFGHLDIAETSLITAAVFLAVYGAYFLLTYVASRSIVREAQQQRT